MGRLVVVLSFGLMILIGSALPAHAAGSPTNPQHTSNWQQRDTAIYVVSTLNLLRDSSGQLLVAKLNVAHFDVYADSVDSDLYFIQLRGKSGGLVGLLAYQMGWQTPKSMSRSTSRLGIRRAPRDDGRAYRTDAKQLIGSFTSTSPGT